MNRILISRKNMSKFRDYSNYEVYDDGHIWSYKTKRFLKPTTMPNGYQVVNLYDNDGKTKQYYLHRVVYEAVTGEPIPSDMEINHRSEVKTENMISNLELVTHKENLNWGTRNSRASKALSKQVGAFKDGKLIMIFKSTNEAGRNGFDKSAVAKCCMNCFNREGNNVYKGYTWKYL